MAKKRAAKRAPAAATAIEAQPTGRTPGPCAAIDPKWTAKAGVDRQAAGADGRTFVTIRLPIGPPAPKGYLPRKVETRLDQTTDQPLTLRRIFDGMQAQHERLNNGKHVDSYAECVRRVLELVAESFGVPTSVLDASARQQS